MNNNSFVIDLFNQQNPLEDINVRLSSDKKRISLILEQDEYLGDCACSMKNDFSQKLNTNKGGAENKPKIFISYAREDEKTAKQLFDELKQAGYDPWLDFEKLLPGEDLELEIKRAIRKSDFIVVCLSKISIEKYGQVQTEWNFALKEYGKYPKGTVFIIPLRLDDCKIPEIFEDILCIDYFFPNSLRILLTTLRTEMMRREEKKGIKKMTEGENEKNNYNKIEFINREHELDEIRNPGGPQLMGIDAPPGYGKSRLLDEVENWYKTEKMDDWICVRINMNLNIDNYSKHPLLILDSIAEQIIGKKIQFHHSQEMMGQMINYGKNIILLFDAIESNPPAVKWLQSDFILPLLNKIKLTKLICRVIFAGRYIQNPRRDWQGQHIEWNWTNYKIVKLTVLDINIVRQAILKELEKTYLREAQQEVLTKEISLLSGGHPGIIEKMLHNPPNGSWALAFHEDKFTLETKKELFQNYSKPVIDNILAEIKDKNLSEILKTLSIFRRFNFNTIRALQSLTRKKIEDSNFRKTVKELVRGVKIKDLLKTFGIIKDNAMLIITNLVNSGLVSAPTLTKQYYHDATIRKLILIQFQIDKNSSRYLMLHALAHAIYDTWINDKNVNGRELSPPLADNVQADFIAESFYHLLNCLAKEQQIHNERIIKAKIKSYVKILRSSFDTPKSVLQDNLKSILKQDEDIPAILQELLGEDGANRVFALLG